MKNDESDQDAVRRAIGTFARAFAAADGEALARLWDDEYRYPVYQPEETSQPFLTVADVRAYFDHLPAVIRGVTDIRPVDFQMDILGDVAHAYSRADATLTFVRDGAPLTGEVRQSFLLRKRDGQWRFIHYHESRLTPGLEEMVG